MEIPFPLGLWDLSLLFGISGILLLITSELLSPQYGKVNILIDRERIKNVALVALALFFVISVLRVIYL
jgi:hypothetical protein